MHGGRIAHWLLAVLLGTLLSGCLLTLGGPLARRVEPGRWRVEAAAGPSLIQLERDTMDGLVYCYAGRALGRHWEVGLMPYLYSAAGTPVLALAAPGRWDPFPHDWALHLVPFAGPVLFYSPGVVAGGGLGGLGLSLRLGELAEFYAAGSSFVPNISFASASAGVRFDLANGFELGVGGVFLFSSKFERNPGLILASVTVGTLLGKP